MSSGPVSGDILGDRYVLKKSEWSSPLGPVWLARDRVLDRAVLVQLLSPALASKQHLPRMFQKAAARIAQIGGPGLLHVYDIGNTPAFAVLEHATGGRLAERMTSGPMRPTDAARAVLTLARGLESLHERGTWHGSLSPNTVFFDEEGRAKLFAVGLADVARGLPRVKIPTDQPDAYRPPEADPIPADADRYALAALLYEMVTGSRPEPGVPARAKRRGIPPEIDELLQRALSPDPKQRPGLDEFEGALAPFARVLPPDVKQPRFAAAEYRWLIPVILIVGLAIAALTFGVQIAKDIGKPKAQTTTTVSPVPQGAGLEVASVRDFDPFGNPPEEHPDKAKLTIDGDPVTNWDTVDYKSVDLDKPGVGLVFELASQQTIRSVTIKSSLPGWQADIRVSDTLGTRPDDFEKVATFTAKSSTSVSISGGRSARYVLLWITRLAPNESNADFPFSADVNEVQFFG